MHSYSRTHTILLPVNYDQNALGLTLNLPRVRMAEKQRLAKLQIWWYHPISTLGIHMV